MDLRTSKYQASSSKNTKRGTRQGHAQDDEQGIQDFSTAERLFAQQNNPNIIYLTGKNIFDAPVSVPIIHCISKIGKLRKGFGVQLVNRYPELEAPHAGDIGSVVATHCDDDRMIFSLIVKLLPVHRSTDRNFKKCLTNLESLVRELDIKIIAMPQIGCGMDRKHWGTVLSWLQHAFRYCPCEIRVYILKNEDG